MDLRSLVMDSLKENNDCPNMLHKYMGYIYASRKLYIRTVFSSVNHPVVDGLTSGNVDKGTAVTGTCTSVCTQYCWSFLSKFLNSFISL